MIFHMLKEVLSNTKSRNWAVQIKSANLAPIKFAKSKGDISI